MKTKMLRLIPVVLMMTILFTIGTIASADEIKYCGELQLKVTVGNVEVGVVSFHLLSVEDHFLIVHSVIIPVPVPGDLDYKPILMSGTAQVVDLEENSESHRVLFMNLTYSQEHYDYDDSSYWHDGRNAQVSLYLSNSPVNGWFWMVGIDHDLASSSFGYGFDKFSVELVGELPKCLRKSEND